MRGQVEHEYEKLAGKHEYEKLKHMTDPNLTFNAIQVAASNKNGKSGKKEIKKIEIQSKLRKTRKKTTKGRNLQDKSKLDVEGNLLGYEKMEWLDGYDNRDVGNMKIQKAACSHPTPQRNTEDSGELTLEIQKGWKTAPASRKWAPLVKRKAQKKKKKADTGYLEMLQL